MVEAQTGLIYGLNALAAGLVLLAAFGMVTTRQVQGVLRFLIFNHSSWRHRHS